MTSVNTKLSIFFVLSITATTSIAGSGFIETIQTPDAERPCYFFKLKNVFEADPIVKDNPWFAIAKSHKGYKEIVSTIITAFSLKKQVIVGTTGAVATSCEHAEVSYVRVEDEPI